jgi:hypothetical protein
VVGILVDFADEPEKCLVAIVEGRLFEILQYLGD